MDGSVWVDVGAVRPRVGRGSADGRSGVPADLVAPLWVSVVSVQGYLAEQTAPHHAGGYGDIDGDLDPSGLDSLRIFTVRGIIAFLVVFGWTGLVMNNAGIDLWIVLVTAFVSGFAMMIVLSLLIKAVMKLRNDGNLDNKNALGVSGRVYLTIPPSRTGEGKVNILLQGTYVEMDAVTDEDAPITTGSEVVVTGISGQTTLIVKRK